MLSGAFISAVLGNNFEGRKIAFMSQTLRFTAPSSSVTLLRRRQPSGTSGRIRISSRSRPAVKSKRAR